MQINIEKNLVEFTPENDDETKKIEALWRLMVDCARFNKKMVPIGEYIPANNAFARFAIETVDWSWGTPWSCKRFPCGHVQVARVMPIVLVEVDAEPVSGLESLPDGAPSLQDR